MCSQGGKGETAASLSSQRGSRIGRLWGEEKMRMDARKQK